MHFGISLPNNQGVARVDQLISIARDAESLGFHSAWTSEHLFHSTYVAERLGDRPYHEALTVLTAVASKTSSIRLGTSVLILPWHHPVRLAKSIASLDDLSNGRVNLGVGVAVTEDEYRNLGVDFSARGKIADEMLAAMRNLWTEDLPQFDGDYFSFRGLRFEPKPVQNPLPIYVGGNSKAAFRRLQAFGDAWHPLSLPVNKLKESIGRLQGNYIICPRMVIQFLDVPSERPLLDRRTLRGTPDELREIVSAFTDLGVDELVLDPATGDLDRFRQTMTSIRDELMN